VSPSATLTRKQRAEFDAMQPSYRIRVTIIGPSREVPLYTLNTLLKAGNSQPIEAGDILRQPLTDLCADGEVEFMLTARQRQAVLAWRDNLQNALGMPKNHALVQVFNAIEQAVPIPAAIMTLLESMLAEIGNVSDYHGFAPSLSHGDREMLLNWWMDARNGLRLPRSGHPLSLIFVGIERTPAVDRV